MPRRKLIVGLMSGTSLDGIDAVLVQVTAAGARTRFRQRAFLERPIPAAVKRLLLKNSQPERSRVDEIARLNMLLAHLYADAVRAVARKAGVPLSRIDLIGSHGQTIQHLPKPRRMEGKTIRATLQIGDPSVLATLTGIPTVGNFRVADMAVGGQGAPLVPYFDWLVFRSRTKNRLLLNIGGIANLTILPKNPTPNEVMAFDTGPGNMVVDALMHRLYGKPYDRGGRTALAGMVSLDLLGWMQRHPYLKRRPPKSTGREEFGEAFVERLLTRARGLDHRDIIATASEFTAYAVHDAYRRFARRRVRVQEVIVSGGGARNRYIMDALQRQFRDVQVHATDQLGIASDAKEATCFAILANESVEGIPANIPAVTGASRRVVLGLLSRPAGSRRSS